MRVLKVIIKVITFPVAAVVHEYRYTHDSAYRTLYDSEILWKKVMKASNSILTK